MYVNFKSDGSSTFSSSTTGGVSGAGLFVKRLRILFLSAITSVSAPFDVICLGFSSVDVALADDLTLAGGAGFLSSLCTIFKISSRISPSQSRNSKSIFIAAIRADFEAGLLTPKRTISTIFLLTSSSRNSVKSSSLTKRSPPCKKFCLI